MSFHLYTVYTEILVYTDGGEGASESCVAMTTECLRQAVSQEPGDYVVSHTTAEEITRGALESCCLLAVPGGRDLPYVDKLKGRGNSLIKEFVTIGGGGYLGICAGAYYASSFVEFARGDPLLEVVGWRELGFFSGAAVGPLYTGFDYQTHSGARAAELHLTNSSSSEEDTMTTLTAYYNGGCHFTPHLPSPHSSPSSSSSSQMASGAAGPVEVLATYPTGEVAVLRSKVGRGRVLLSGVHLEASSEQLDCCYRGDEYITQLLGEVESCDAQRRQFVQSCVKYLLKT